jgi:MFS family permease
MTIKSEIMEDSKVLPTNSKDIEELDQISSALDHAGPPEEHFPDGGLKAWCTVAGGFLSFIATIGFLSGGSVFQSYFMTTKLPTSSPDDIAWIGSVQIWGCFFFGMWSGRLSDKYGPRPLLAVGGFFLVLGNMMSSLSAKYYQFLLSQGFCVALGMGLAFTPALAVQSQWFLRHRGFAVALVMSGQNLGGTYLWTPAKLLFTNSLLLSRGYMASPGE